MSKMLTDKDYVKSCGTICPKCRSKEVEGTGKQDWGDADYMHMIECHDCEYIWWDMYKLSGYAEV